VQWSETEADPYKVYAVYYRQENSDADFTVVKTSSTEVVLDNLDPNTNYDLALVSANALGHSPFLEMKIVGTSGNVFSKTLAIFKNFLKFGSEAQEYESVRTDAYESTVQCYAGSTGHTVTTLFFFLFLIAAAAACTLYTVRTNAWPKILQKLNRNHPLSDRDPTVAFENPGYGTEVQIRGLAGHSDPVSATEWQNADLEVADNMATEANNGMRYAKLNSS
ncbi:unnamed protein product, partial [Gongylonema pulchrum]|uniref:Fibronectin type-III domain-containing protein n=1 Tax=Gongylonema pulchrum TaxID=637853 RepID=A0A183EWQ8_9BILA